MQDFRRLAVWEKGHALTLSVYKATTAFPKSEMFGLTSQMRRAAASIPTNIAEGCGRDGGPDFGRFLNMAMGSASELEYLVLLTHDLELLKPHAFKQLNDNVTEIKRMLAALIKRIKNHPRAKS